MAIRPIADAIARVKAQPGFRPATEEFPGPDSTSLVSKELHTRTVEGNPLAQGPVAVAETAGPKGRPSITEIVAKWHADCLAAAPALHHRERGEWIGEQLPALVAALQAREA